LHPTGFAQVQRSLATHVECRTVEGPSALRFRYRRHRRDAQGQVYHLAEALTEFEPVRPRTVRDDGEAFEWPGGLVAVLGYVLLPGRVWVRAVDVHPDFRRRGIATALLTDVRRRHPRRRPVHDGLTVEGTQWWATFGMPDDDWLE
jgi:GNAT superfamily N-acetyltransferase